MVTLRVLGFLAIAGGVALASSACSNLSHLDTFTFGDVCVPEALDVTCKGVECGPRTNNCGEPVDCPDTCLGKGNGTETCGDNPEQDPNRCGCVPEQGKPLKCCVPDPIEKICFGVQCGPKTDNCGQERMCPDTCNAPDSCGDRPPDNDPNKCGCTSPSVVESCAAVECGSVRDKCGQEVSCPSTCGPLKQCEVGGASKNTCGCTGMPLAIPDVPECDKFLGSAQYGNDGRAYYVCSSDSQAAGRAFCRSYGTDLVRPKDAQQNAFVAAIAQQSGVISTWGPPYAYWLGLEDPLCKGGTCNYAWIDGTPLTYSNYNFGEPNNTGGGEHCIEAQAFSTGWNDIPCANVRGVICETTCD